jgi:hypothetical protein
MGSKFLICTSCSTIVGFQIEINFFFNVAKVITCLRCCQLEIYNLNNLVIIMQNWLKNLGFRCTNMPKSLKELFDIQCYGFKK